MQRLRELTEQSANADYEASVVRIRSFHAALADASGNARLAATLATLLDGSQLLYFAGLGLSPGIEDHHQLLG